MTDETYNGWKNWETWNTNLWIANEEGWYNEAREIVARHTEEPEEGETLEGGAIRTVDIYRAGKDLAEWWDETAGPENRSGPLADTWNACQSAVDWEEIAEGLAEE